MITKMKIKELRVKDLINYNFIFDKNYIGGLSK